MEMQNYFFKVNQISNSSSHNLYPPPNQRCRISRNNSNKVPPPVQVQLDSNSNSVPPLSPPTQSPLPTKHLLPSFESLLTPRNALMRSTRFVKFPSTSRWPHLSNPFLLVKPPLLKKSPSHDKYLWKAQVYLPILPFPLRTASPLPHTNCPPSPLWKTPARVIYPS